MNWNLILPLLRRHSVRGRWAPKMCGCGDFLRSELARLTEKTVGKGAILLMINN